MRSVVLLAVAAAAAAACAGDPPSMAPTTAPAVAGSDPLAPTTLSTSSVGTDSPCVGGRTVVDGRIENPSLTEASGLAASRTHAGVLWSHNDGNDLAGLFAIGADGRDLGFHPLDIDGVIDVEDLALVDGPERDDLLLADIGDNRLRRPGVRLYRVPEPDPARPGPLGDVEVLEFVYPDGPHDAEVLLVDDVAGTVVIVTKERKDDDQLPRDFAPTAPSLVFEGPLSGAGTGPVVLELVGTVDMPALELRAVADRPHPSSLLGIGGLPTGGDVAPDGTRVALRTYETAWEWTREPGRGVAEALAGEPCQVLVAAEPQGEALAFDADDLVTVGEGAGPPVNRVVR